MDRDALVRVVRRRQALEALTFERERAALLAEQLEETVASIEGARVDAALYAELSPDDVKLVRAALRDYEPEADDDDDPETADDAEAVDSVREDEEEISRLQDELALSSRSQAALERYLDLL